MWGGDWVAEGGGSGEVEKGRGVGESSEEEGEKKLSGSKDVKKH